MKLLLSNDDGIRAEGISALAKALCSEHTVMISAPDTERSCVSRAMTLTLPLRAAKTELAGLETVLAYAVSGTPVDCVRLGLGNLFESEQPDMVVSGINHGSNLGTDALYSGTVGAAHEAALLGLPALAISVCAYRPKHLDSAARLAPLAVDYIQKHPLPFGTVLSLNVPDLPFSEIRGVKLVPAGVVQYQLKFVKARDPHGGVCYWPPCGRVPFDPASESDDRWASEGFATLTPLTYDLTNWEILKAMEAPDWLK